MSEGTEIPIEEEVTEEMGGEEKTWSEEVTIASAELWHTLMGLVDEANVRRVTIKDGEGKTLISVPLWVGVGAVAVMQIYSAVALIAAMVMNLSIVIERAEKEPEVFDVQVP